MSDPVRASPKAGAPHRSLLLNATASLCVLYATFCSAYAAWDQDWTTDEHVHLQWSQRLYETGETERDSAGRFASTTPIHLPNVALRAFAGRQGLSAERPLRFAARVPQVFWLLVTLVAVFGAASRIAGGVAARLAVIFTALDMSLVANSTVATTDMPLAAATALSFWAALAFRGVPGAAPAVAIGLSLGLALTAKFSAILLVPFALLCAFGKKGGLDRRSFLHLVLIALAAWGVLVTAYGTRDLFGPMRSFNWRSPTFQSAAKAFPSAPVILPVGFLEGIDRSRARDATAVSIVAILGQVSEEPLPYFFVAAWAFKTPIALMLICIAASPWILTAARQSSAILILVLHQAAVLTFFSLGFRTQVGSRYVLMMLPLTYVLTAVAMATNSSAPRAGAIGALVAALAAGESARYVGDPLAFSNAIVYPKAKAYLFLANADIDWNQNRERWSVAQKKAGLPDNGSLNPVDVQPGLNVLSTSVVAGVLPGDRFRWIRENLEPRAMAGFTHHYFEVNDQDFSRFLGEERRLVPKALANELCGLDAQGQMDPPGQGLPYETEVAPPSLRVSALCVATRKGTDIEARVEEGRFDYMPAGRPDLRTYLPFGQKVQFRLDPGVHALLILETPYRRTSLPYRVRAVFSALGHGALLRIVPVSHALVGTLSAPEEEDDR